MYSIVNGHLNPFKGVRFAPANDQGGGSSTETKDTLSADIKTKLKHTITQMFSDNKFLHAADESGGNIQKKFEGLGIPYEDQHLSAYRMAMMQAESYEFFVGGTILFEHTVNTPYHETSFVPFLADVGVQPGIKVDKGLQPFNGSTVEQVGKDALSDLDARMEKFASLGLTFAKFRVVGVIGEENGITCPTDECLRENAKQLAVYASICQKHGVVPIVEPEVPMQGSHTIEECERATTRFNAILMEELKSHQVYLPGVIVKTNMIVAGDTCSSGVATPTVVAEKTMEMISNPEVIDPSVGAVVFLSGGQLTDDAYANLSVIRDLYNNSDLPFFVASSFSRTLQSASLEAYAAAWKETGSIYAAMEAATEAFDASLGQNNLAMSSN